MLVKNVSFLRLLYKVAPLPLMGRKGVRAVVRVGAGNLEELAGIVGMVDGAARLSGLGRATLKSWRGL